MLRHYLETRGGVILPFIDSKCNGLVVNWKQSWEFSSSVEKRLPCTGENLFMGKDELYMNCLLFRGKLSSIKETHLTTLDVIPDVGQINLDINATFKMKLCFG